MALWIELDDLLGRLGFLTHDDFIWHAEAFPTSYGDRFHINVLAKSDPSILVCPELFGKKQGGLMMFSVDNALNRMKPTFDRLSNPHPKEFDVFVRFYHLCQGYDLGIY